MSEVEVKLNQLKNILSKMRYVKYGDYVYAEDHNLIVDAIKIIADIVDYIKLTFRPVPPKELRVLDSLLKYNVQAFYITDPDTVVVHSLTKDGDYSITASITETGYESTLKSQVKRLESIVKANSVYKTYHSRDKVIRQIIKTDTVYIWEITKEKITVTVAKYNTYVSEKVTKEYNVVIGITESDYETVARSDIEAQKQAVLGYSYELYYDLIPIQTIGESSVYAYNGYTSLRSVSATEILVTNTEIYRQVSTEENEIYGVSITLKTLKDTKLMEEGIKGAPAYTTTEKEIVVKKLIW